MTFDVDAILASLSLEEKVSLLDGRDYWHTQPLPEHDVPAVMLTDGPHGLRKQVDVTDQFSLSRLLPATCFPTASALACSWDTELVQRVGVALGDECRAAGVGVLLGPGMNIKRTPLCGRNFEYFSEDPLLTGELAAAMVRGIQSRGVGATPKHFAANNQETERMTISAEVDERTLREIYLAAFERVVTESRPWALMCAYNQINGTYASENSWLLDEVLRGEWGFDGLTISDWGAVNRRDAALVAGLDLEMPSSRGLGAQTLLDAIAAGTVDDQVIDRAARRVLGLVNRAAAPGPQRELQPEAHHALAREAAAASVVLLKNEDALLPIDPATGGAVAVIGEFARTPRFQGAGSSQVKPTRVESPLAALQLALDGTRELRFAPGFEPESEAADAELVAAAVQLAAGAQDVIVFLGLPPAHESEGFDRATMSLPSNQLALLAALAAVNQRIVVVLANGSAVLTAELERHAAAILEAWLPGQAGGTAIADILLGNVCPSGKLAETFPLAFEHNPTLGNYPGESHRVIYGERLLVGYRWYDTHRLPVSFAFGHGLSYTEFDYSNLRLTLLDDTTEPRVAVSFELANVGACAGSETVQIYVHDPVASVERPEQELRAFRKLMLAPGQRTTVTLELGWRAFSYWHPGLRRWGVEHGEFEIRVGSSSRDIRLSEAVKLTGTDLRDRLTRNSTTGEFLDNAITGPLVRALVPGWALRSMDQQTGLGAMLRMIPLIRLGHFFPESPISGEQIDEFVAATRS